MQNKVLLQFRRFDAILLAATALLILLGLIVLYSSGLKAGSTANQLDTSRQIIYVGVGLLIFWVVSRIDYNVLRNYSNLLYITMVGFLLLVEIFGATRLGATRWISLGFFQFQPSEFAKLALIIVLAKFFSDNYEKSNEIRYVLMSLLYLLPPLVLVLSQPDLGTALVLVMVWLAMALTTKLKMRYFVIMLVVLLISLPVIYPRLAPYQRQRIATFINPTANPDTTGYNVNQAIIAVGSGGLFGQGLSSGSQSQGNFLPSQHTDFIFAVLSEKLGFLGGLLCIFLYCVIVVRAIWIAKNSADRFGTLLAIGIATMFAFHVVVNISMNIGLLPVTGIPLPFISAGGTSMMISLISIAILESIYGRRRSISLNTKEIYE
ncbi:MAG TPA: rod shape-determining protein RodA [Candidatus Saccharibacteria bacterium]|nr:rod shape-determining protein RodA [Candidatus Saccharibacteria bacterium]HMT39891.1 rod shape-determining protein RodA [Candidatus Saccharibacteria bacterium]